MVTRARLNAKRRRRRILSASVVVAFVALVLVGYLLYQASNTDTYSSYIGQPVSQSIMQQLTGVSDSTLAAVGMPSGVTPPASITGTALTSGGKPEVFYAGGDYCPYCAVERWSLIVALSRFGNFSGLEYMQSSATDVNANSPTFTFSSAAYTSKYVAFVPVEEFDRTGAVRQSLTSDQQSLVTQYDTCLGTGSAGGIPFVDIANAYAVNCGAQLTLDVSGQNWTAIASQLDNPNSPTASQIDGAANTLITAICKVDGGQPASVCHMSYATLPLAFASPGAASRTDLAASPTERVDTGWTA